MGACVWGKAEMRIALLQIRLNHKSRASNLQTLKRAIDAAASITDAPDLIVLPGACDNGGSASSRGCSRSALEGVREGLAWLAREWGVYIAAGLHAEHEAVWEPCAVLLDPDGDVVAASGGQKDNAPKDLQIGAPAGFWGCPRATWPFSSRRRPDYPPNASKSLSGLTCSPFRWRAS